jgi:peptide/nickel transport system permease protein
MRYWLDRMVETIPLLIGITLITFLIVRASPRDPMALVIDPTMVSPEQRAAARTQLGLDDPLPVQYGKMTWQLVTGQLRSFKSKQPTLTIIFDAFPTTALVGGLGIASAVLIGVGLGSLAGHRPGGWADRAVSVSMVASLAAPSFLLALFLIRLFTEQWRLLPASGIGPPGTIGFHPQPQYLVMPVAVIAFGFAPILARYLRDALVTVLSDDYVRTARAKGVAESGVVVRHALRNAMIPILSLLNTFIPITLGGMVIIESVFGLPGLGRVTTNAALSADYPVVMTGVVFVAILVLVTNLLIDALYGVIDPRVRVQAS